MDSQAYLEFVKYCLRCNTEIPKCASKINWLEFYKFCDKQAIIGIVFDGISQMDKLRMPSDDLLEWMDYSENIKSDNYYIYQVCTEIQEKFSKAGYRSCILKGLGNALMYPNPLLRMSGDIDIWVDGSRKNITRLLKSMKVDAHENYKDASFYYKDVNIEVHFIPTYLNNFYYNKRLKKFIEIKRNSQFENSIKIPYLSDNKNITVATDDFNVVYQMAHLYHHFFCEGIGLRHFIDYYYLLKRHDFDAERIDFGEYGMKRFASGVMWIEQEILGLEGHYIITKPNKKIGSKILKEVLCYGNFNHEGYSDKSNIYVKLSNTFKPIKYIFLFPQGCIDRIIFICWLQLWKIRQMIK